MTLPITAILPTRNAMGAIEPHIRAIREWLPHVAQVVVVDSSEDGTLDYLRAEIALSNVEFHSRPRGLYEGWNFGVRQAREEFVYFSTVGDTIDFPGLQHLLAAIRAADADILISPPAMLDDRGVALPPGRWPIHSITENLPSAEPRRLAPADVFRLAVSFVPETLLGSSAGNLYRTAFLAGHPFPEGWGHCADSAWMISHSLAARVAVTARAVSQFIVHAKEPFGGFAPAVEITQFDDMFRRGTEALEAAMLPDEEREILRGWLVALRRRYQQFFDRLEMHKIYFARRDERIRAATERGDKFKARVVLLEDEVRSTREKVIALRRDIGAYARIHRSLPRMIRLYLSVKWSQARKVAALIRQKFQRSST